MFEIGWTEMLVIAIVMIVVVGPKDLPKMLRTIGKTTAKLRSMAGDFQKQFNEALKEAELDDVKKSVDALRGLNPTAEIRKQLNPFEKAAADVRAGLDAAMKPKPSTAAEPASAVTHAAEPAKGGATEMPGVAGPEAMPAAPAFPAMADPSVSASTAASAPFDGSAPPKAAPPAKMNGAAVTAKSAAKPAAAAAKPKAVAASRTPKPTAKAPVHTAATKARPASTKKPAGSTS